MKYDYIQIIARRIHFLCEQRGITMYRLGIMSGLNQSTIDNLVNNRTFDPRIQTLHKIALGFSMTLAEFLDFEELNNYSFDE